MPMYLTKNNRTVGLCSAVLCAVVMLLAVGRLQGTECNAGAQGVVPDFSQVDSLMRNAVDSARVPGGVVCVVADTGVVYLQAYGARAVYPDTLPMTVNTVFDLASMSKPLVAMAVLRLVAEGKVSPDSPVSDYLPEFEGKARVVHLLTHTSGLPAYVNPRKLELLCGAATPQNLIRYICHCPRSFPAGTACRYSCLNYIALQHVVERVSGDDLAAFCAGRVFRPLGMMHTAYCPPPAWQENMAATEMLPDSTVLCGVVHDPLARLVCNGVSGNAGIFSTAEDLARLAMFLLSDTAAADVCLLTQCPDSLAFAGRTCGWAKKTGEVRFMGTRTGECTYGHTGYTGTSMVVDPEKCLAVILLTNRVHPHDKGNINALRAAVTDAAVEAIALAEQNARQ